MIEVNKFLNEIQDESVPFDYSKRERKLIPLKKGNIRKRKDGYYCIAVCNNGNERKAIVPKDTIERLVKEGNSFRVLKDRCNTLSALGNDFDKPLMFYAIVAYNLVPKDDWQKWKNSTPLLEYELIHLNGDIDDIRKENVKLALRDEKIWSVIKEEYKKENKIGADQEYTRKREEFLRSRFTAFPNLKVMTRVTDIVRKNKQDVQKDIEVYDKELLETIS